MGVGYSDYTGAAIERSGRDAADDDDDDRQIAHTMSPTLKYGSKI